MHEQVRRTISIGEAARLASVTVKQIRHWQSRGYIPERPRVICGRRAYRQFGDDDVENIRKVKSYLDQGYSLPVAAEKALKDLKQEVMANEKEK